VVVQYNCSEHIIGRLVALFLLAAALLEGFVQQQRLNSVLRMAQASGAAGGDSDEVAQLIRSLQSKDRFFAQEEGVIAVFDFDYETVASFQKSVALVSFIFPPILIIGSLCCYPCFFAQQIDWNTYSQHVAITQDGIKFVQDKRKTGCGLGCQDEGKTSKTVPFDKVTDCDVTEPAGATCFCVQNVLPVVNVDTASGARTGGEGGPKHELSLIGLKESHKFKKLVWAMKRAQAQGGGVMARVATSPGAYETSAAPTMSSMDRGISSEETNAILRDIRSQLIELNENIKNVTKE